VINTYYRDLHYKALNAGASASQLDQILEWGRVAESDWYASGALTRANRRDLKDYPLRIKLDRWLTALEVGYKPNEFWQAALGNGPTPRTKY
jgi:hypothetical protein